MKESKEPHTESLVNSMILMNNNSGSSICSLACQKGLQIMLDRLFIGCNSKVDKWVECVGWKGLR